jgi:tripartite motif-containing protein 71
MNNFRIQKYDSNGTFMNKWGSKRSGAGQLLLPLGIDLDSFDNVFAIDQGQSNFQKFTSNGTFLTKWDGQGSEAGGGEKFVELEDIELDGEDNIFVTDKGDSSIKKFTSE